MRAAAAGVRRSERKLVQAVELARAAGVSWERIGRAVDMTGRGAQKRFGA